MNPYHVAPREDGKWAVIKEGAKRAASLHKTQEEALKKASEINEKFESKTPSTPPTRAFSALADRIGHRVKRARLMRGLSLRELAAKLDSLVSHTYLQKFENGASLPDSEILGRLASVLNLRPDYFLQKNCLVLKGVEYRKQTKLGKKRQVQLEEEAFEFFERYLEIEKILGLSRPPLPEFDWRSVDVAAIPGKIEQATIKIRESWELGLNPLPNVHAMLEENGVKVKILPEFEGFDGFSAFATDGTEDIPTVALSRALLSDLPRFRFTALHELAHLCLRFPPGLEARVTEGFCHRFASAFLVPKERFLLAFGRSRAQISIPELFGFKKEWGISFAAIMRRALDLGAITPGRYKSFQFFRNKRGWRTQEPGEWCGDEQSDRFDQLILRALAEKRISMSKASGLLELTQDELSERFELLG